MVTSAHQTLPVGGHRGPAPGPASPQAGADRAAHEVGGRRRGSAEQGLAQAAEVDVLRSADGEAVYRRCTSGEHHHHLVCRTCGRTVEVAGPAVERWAEKVAAEHGFAEVSHTLEVFGTCAACAEPAASG